MSLTNATYRPGSTEPRWSNVLGATSDGQDVGREPSIDHGGPERLLDRVPVTICVVDEQGVIRQLSARAHDLLGLEPVDCEGTQALGLIHPADRSRAGGWFAAMTSGEHPVPPLVCQVLQPNGHTVTVEIMADRAEDEREGALVCTIRQLERRRSAQPSRYVEHGPEGTVTRDAFARSVNELDEHGAARPIVVFVDIDDFRGIERAYGATAATEIVRIARDVLFTIVRHDDVVGRVGNGSLAALIADVPDREVPRLLRRISRALHRPVSTSAGRIRMSVSVGAARPQTQPVGVTFGA